MPGGFFRSMMVVMITLAVPPITMTAVAMGALAAPENSAMKAAVIVEIAAVKASVMVETATKPKPDSNANRNCGAISAKMGIRRFSMSGVGLILVGILRI